MVKKRQDQPFQKTHLKPGRPIGKRKNVTSTSFKSKKIMVHNKKHKEKSDKTIPECLKNIRDGTLSSLRVSNLNHLTDLIKHQSESLSLYLSEIMESVFKIILEVDDNLRNAALNVMMAILRVTDDSQIHSFVPHLTNVLSCAMTHTSCRIKTNSLVLLDCLLKHHPDLICHSMTILNNLLEMASEPPRLPSQRITPNSSAPDEPVYYSSKYQINILGHINVFLKEMLKNKSFLMDNDRDEQEVYWDCKSPMDLVIYAGSGLHPVDIEKPYSDNFYIHDAYFDDSGDIEKFIDGMIKLLPTIYCEEIASESKFDDKILHRSTIENLSILFQVFSSVAEWAKLILYDEVDSAIREFLGVQIHKAGRFPFETTGSVGSGIIQFPPCVQLNLAVCFLYGKFLVQPGKDNEEYNCDIFDYVKKVLAKHMTSNIKYDSIPMLVKIMKIYFSMREMSEVSEFLHSSLSHLCGLLNPPKNYSREDHSSLKMLISLFTKMSLDSAYHFLAESDAMKNWFSWLLKELIKVKINKPDKRILITIKKIANRKFPCFLELLSSMEFSTLKTLLKHDNEDVRDTAIFLIYNMQDISENYLENISRIILLDPNFPQHCACRLIRLLSYRFFDKPENGEVKEFSMYNEKGFVNYTLFLLNIAVDSYNLNNDDMIDFEANEYTKAMKPLKDGHAFNIFPSLHWKEHSVLFNVCFKFLNRLPQKAVSNVMMEMFKEILNNTTTLPIHSAIAILKLNNREGVDMYSETDDKYYPQLIFDLTFSCLITTSVLTHMSTEDEWYQWNVLELMNSMELSRRIAFQTVTVLADNSYGKPEGIVVYHILRIIHFFVEREVLESEDTETILPILESLKDKCSDRTMKNQPLFLQLYHFFSYYL